MKLLHNRKTSTKISLSVLSVEPYGMKLLQHTMIFVKIFTFSALGRAVWDETSHSISSTENGPYFQCSRSSRMGWNRRYRSNPNSHDVLSVLSVEPYGMKLMTIIVQTTFLSPFSALGRAVWDETRNMQSPSLKTTPLSVLSVEPYGMKHKFGFAVPLLISAFSALGRAVWDETAQCDRRRIMSMKLSVLSVEPYGMKHLCRRNFGRLRTSFQCSRSSRMGWNMVLIFFIVLINRLSVLSVEPYGMKHKFGFAVPLLISAFSALGRAVWDETEAIAHANVVFKFFQCSRSSRMGWNACG